MILGSPGRAAWHGRRRHGHCPQGSTREGRAVEVWRADGELQLLEKPRVLEACPGFPGLQLRLAEIWAG